MSEIRPFGDEALLIEADDDAAVLALAHALGQPPAGVVDVVPAARTVLVAFDRTRIGPAAVRSWIASAAAGAVAVTDDGEDVVIPVHYDGADLADTAALLGVTVDRLIEDHMSAPWRVALTGFAPGFGYLVSTDWPHRVPRLAVPRTRVPAGADPLADGHAGVYPRATPGGWRLIGSTDLTLFDPDRTPPALLAPGTRVRFERRGPE
ncbi:5-oxoprolinase subunit B family protein [Microbacterium gorillae]|uniref:5-oxoprolinase subunit B family protein n=1 Tax=Microbacterium gorillae TaxID=1231063 RepID=UPI00058B0BFB|nr:allophanate hydrolase subunit 1 [Microbacterium gorillae]